MENNLNGVLLLNKPVGISSQTAVFKVKKLLNSKKAGHLGTLDPLASGVLPITVGKSTRLFDYFLNKTKTYKAVFAFGFTTDTLDCEGKVLETKKQNLSLEGIKNVLKNFIGDLQQLPPKYSAKNINGQKAYNLARAGVEFELKPKKITIFNIKAEEVDEKLKNISLNNFKKFNKDENKETILNKFFNNLFTFEIECSAGTYIRSLCRDIATALNTIGTMVWLNRISCGDFKLEDCISFEDIEKGNYKILKPEEVINLEKLEIDKMQAKKLLCGQDVEINFVGQKKLFCKDEFLGIASSKNGKLKIDTYLLED